MMLEIAIETSQPTTSLTEVKWEKVAIPLNEQQQIDKLKPPTINFDR